mmetsp:Transcript_41450/g.130717  ORF Transcript_41450/g.130717 Transcript_41450/m.130717 type:complete len:219 (-) Transcript_41450:51-707(-)
MRAAKGSGLERRRETPHFAGRVDGGEARQAPHHRPEQFLGLRPPHCLGAAAGERQAEQLECAQPSRGVGRLRVGHCAEQQPVGERCVERRARVVGEREDGLGGRGALAREQPRECAPSEPRGRLLAMCRSQELHAHREGELRARRAAILQQPLQQRGDHPRGAPRAGGAPPPAGAAVVCFPRSPKPHEAPEQWVAQHWTEGRGGETALEERPTRGPRA